MNIDDGLLDEVFEDLPGNNQAKSQPAPRSSSKVKLTTCVMIMINIVMTMVYYHCSTGFWMLWRLLLLCNGWFQSRGSSLCHHRWELPLSRMSASRHRWSFKPSWPFANRPCLKTTWAQTMKVTTFSSTSDERWNISSPEVFPYFLLPPVDDTGAFKDG